jgi:hypothetical protein
MGYHDPLSKDGLSEMLHEVVCNTVAYSDLRNRAGRRGTKQTSAPMKDCQISSKAGQFLPGQISEIQISSLGFGKNWVLEVNLF